MKKKFGALLGIVTLAGLSAIPLSAESWSVRATIPFEFLIGPDRMPAGDYSLESGALPGALHVIKSDGSAYTFILSQQFEIGNGDRSGAVKLVFHRYGNQYFLREIWDGTRAAGNRIQRSIEEGRLARGNPARAAETVALLAQGN